jgi:hypothetical protein
LLPEPILLGKLHVIEVNTFHADPVIGPIGRGGGQSSALALRTLGHSDDTVDLWVSPSPIANPTAILLLYGLTLRAKGPFITRS